MTHPSTSFMRQVRKFPQLSSVCATRIRHDSTNPGRSGLDDSEAGQGCLAARAALTCRPYYYPASGIHRQGSPASPAGPPGNTQAY